MHGDGHGWAPPEGAITDHLDFLEVLLEADLPDLTGEDIADALKNGAIMNIAAGEVAVNDGGEQARVFPWFEYCHHYEHAPQYLVASWGSS